MSPRTRLAICYEGEIPDNLTDRLGYFQLMNKPKILLCCGNTIDDETLVKLKGKGCPCCRKPLEERHFTKPTPNLDRQDAINEFVKEKEKFAEQEFLAAVAIVKNAQEEKEGQPSRAASLQNMGLFNMQPALPNAPVQHEANINRHIENQSPR